MSMYMSMYGSMQAIDNFPEILAGCIPPTVRSGISQRENVVWTAPSLCKALLTTQYIAYKQIMQCTSYGFPSKW